MSVTTYYNTIDDFLKREHGASIEKLSGITEKESGYIRDLIEDKAEQYRIIDGVVSFNGLGTKLCIVCSKDQDYKSMPITIPEKILTVHKGVLGNGMTLDESLKDGIKGHRGCYENIGLFFRETNILHCADCSHLHNRQVEGNKVLEKCDRLRYEETGHKGVIADNNMCNYFNPESALVKGKTSEDSKKMELWNKIRPSIAHKTLHGYDNLMEILEKTKLLK